MEWQPDDRDAWVADAEKWISQIRGVLQCKIDLSPDGEITGVHVVAKSDREPRHIVRDVEGLLKARLGISVFYKKIGVVQVVEAETAPEPERTLPTPPPAESRPQSSAPANHASAPANHASMAEVIDPVASVSTDDIHDAVLLAEELAPRLLCNGVSVMSTDTLLRAEVDLQAAGLEASGVAEGPNRAGGDLYLVAAAALDAIEALVHESMGLELVELRRDRMGSGEVIIVAVELVKGRRSEQLYGTCQPGQNAYQAVVYAILDAMNRRLEMMLFKAASAAE